ncbi:phage tail sheath protein FI [Bradyrhizobium sp. USDA 3397]
MPASLSYPGVYIEEIPSGVRTITGVETSVTAFLGYAQRGPTNLATQIFNFSDYERAFGGLHPDSDLSYAIQHFFQNGGGKAWVVRVAKGAAKAEVRLKNSVGDSAVTVLTATAKTDGLWGNNLRLDLDYDTVNPASLFNLRVTEFVDRGGTLQPSRVEVHRNLSMSSLSPSYAVDIIKASSDLIEVSRSPEALTAIQNKKATSISGPLADADLTQLSDNRRRLAVTIDGDGPHEFDIFDSGGILSGSTLNQRLDDLAARIEARVRAIKPSVPAFGDFTCTRSDSAVTATSGTPNGRGEESSVRFGNASQRNSAVVLKLGVANGGHEADGAAAIRPPRTGTVGSSLAALNLSTLNQPAHVDVTVSAPGVADDGPHSLTLWGDTGRPASREALRSSLQAALAGSSRAALNQAAVTLSDGALQVVAGGIDPNVRLQFANSGSDTTATTIGLAGGTENVSRYALGNGLESGAQTGALSGDDGTPPSPTELKGSRLAKTGLYALEDVDLFNILCIPNQSDAALLSDALSYVEERRAMLIIDPPSTIDTFLEAKNWIASVGTLRHRNAAAYFPRVRAPDPLSGNRLRSFANSGMIAGLYARTDAARGVWKAAAGMDATLRGVQALEYLLTDQENGALNPVALNCLRNFPNLAPMVWGARTLEGTDQMASEWKYIPVRRLALFIEESLFRGTQWVVFEPNGEELWSQVRLNVGAFMNNLFRQGAFKGTTPREAYLVKCDSETTTQNDINLGIINIVVGFAPLKPAEFVVIKIQQLAGQIQT